MRKSTFRKENYSVSLLSAITQDRVVATQLIEGGVDATVFEQFIHNMLMGIRSNPEYSQRTIVLIMDNASIHHNLNVLDTARQMKANVLFSA